MSDFIATSGSFAKKTGCFLSLGVCALLVGGAGGGQRNPQKNPAKRSREKQLPAIPKRKAAAELEFWLNSPFTKQAAAAQVVAAGHPLVTIALLKRGQDYVVWGLPFQEKIDLTRAPTLPDALLQAVADDRPFVGDLHGKRDLTDREKGEAELYNLALVNVAKFPTEAFAASAAKNSWLTYGHLFQKPDKFRGRVVPMKGTLERLRRFDPPRDARQKWLIADIFEGWVFTETKNAPPVCVMFTNLPPAVQLGEKINYRIKFDGYFFKRYKYLAGDGKFRRTLFFIAPTFTVRDEKQTAAPVEGATLPESIAAGVLLVVAGAVATVLLVVGVNWWFRRGDVKIHSRLSELRSKNVDIPEVSPPEKSGATVEQTAVGAGGDDEEDALSDLEKALKERMSFPD